MVVNSHIRVNTYAAVSHNTLSSAVVNGNIVVSGRYRVTRGIIVNSGATITNNIVVTNDLGVNHCYVVNKTDMVGKRVRVYSGIAIANVNVIVHPVARPNICSSNVPLRPGGI